ncbi:hypothetical protein FHP25_19610 [Vineibacter terrae]|uniref:Uncharacterized protein n=1 Tax=Vineibacter terrae TaxID=2586908 RepID=A0A5C8PJQ2_9HYPH|nr:hypothetical protein [Vineibacter terrae]TXL73860.1 hypothetical protein FHP25_19610 [Vineibacter terrae]
MSKTFFVEPGYEAFNRGVWYGPGILLIVEEGERVEVYAAPNGKPAACVGNHEYTKLNQDRPPTGLRRP